MTDKLTPEENETLVKYRLERAKETLAEVRQHQQNGYFNTAVNRLYYACFYASQALLIRNGHSAATHAGVKSLIGMHFVATGKLTKEAGQNLQTLFNARQSGDYDDFAFVTSESVDELYPKAESYIAEIEKLLEKNNNTN